MQESFHGLLVHNTGTSSIPVRPPSCPSLSFSLPLPLIWDLAHLLRIALRLTRVNILRARRSPSSIRPVLTKPKHRQEHHSRHPPSCSPFPLPSSLLHRQQHLQVFFYLSHVLRRSVLTASSPSLCAAVSPLQPG